MLSIPKAARNAALLAGLSVSGAGCGGGTAPQSPHISPPSTPSAAPAGTPSAPTITPIGPHADSLSAMNPERAQTARLFGLNPDTLPGLPEPPTVSAQEQLNRSTEALVRSLERWAAQVRYPAHPGLAAPATPPLEATRPILLAAVSDDAGLEHHNLSQRAGCDILSKVFPSPSTRLERALTATGTILTGSSPARPGATAAPLPADREASRYAATGLRTEYSMQFSLVKINASLDEGHRAFVLTVPVVVSDGAREALGAQLDAVSAILDAPKNPSVMGRSEDSPTAILPAVQPLGNETTRERSLRFVVETAARWSVFRTTTPTSDIRTVLNNTLTSLRVPGGIGIGDPQKITLQPWDARFLPSVFSAILAVRQPNQSPTDKPVTTTLEIVVQEAAKADVLSKLKLIWEDLKPEQRPVCVAEDPRPLSPAVALGQVLSLIASEWATTKPNLTIGEFINQRLAAVGMKDAISVTQIQ